MRGGDVGGNRLDSRRFNQGVAVMAWAPACGFLATAGLFAAGAKRGGMITIQGSSRTRAASLDTFRAADFL